MPSRSSFSDSPYHGVLHAKEISEGTAGRACYQLLLMTGRHKADVGYPDNSESCS